jgi:tetratricopeptide (TPR) repeat protein
VIFAVALILRVTYILQVRYTPFFQTLGLDAKFYDRWARDIAMGQSEEGAFFMSPLYPYFLAAIYRFFGRDLLLVRMIQAAMGSGSAVLSYLIGRDVFDRKIGILAGLLTACYGSLIFYDGSILMTPLLVLLNLLALTAILRADSSGRPVCYLAGGLALGLAAIGRAATLVPAGAAVMWIVFSGPSSDAAAAASGTGSGVRTASARGIRRTSLRSAIRAAVLVTLGIAVVVTPITIRNYIVSGDFVPITSNGGLNFYIGNSEVATGGYAQPEGLDIVTDPDGEVLAERAVGRDLGPAEVSAYWYSRARQFIAAHPAEWARLMVRKLTFVMSSYELPQLENYYFQKRYAPLLRFPLPGFAVLAPLGLLGLVLSFRHRRAMLLALFSISYLLSIAAFFVVARYRLPVVPILIVFATYALFELWRLVREHKLARLGLCIGGLVALAFVVNANHYHIDKQKGFALAHFRVGIIYSQRGMVDQAIGEFERAIALDPEYKKSYLNLGALFAQGGQHERAIEVFRRVIRLDPGYSLARVNLAMALEIEGEYGAALAQIDTALLSEPGNAMALKERGIILYRDGQFEEAGKWLREALENDRTGEQRAEAEFYLGLIEGPRAVEIPESAREAIARADTLILSGRLTEAMEALEEARRIAPESGEPLRRLAIIKGEIGLLDEAIETMQDALRLDPTLISGHFVLGLLLNEAGRHDEAIQEYEATLRLDPNLLPANLNLALTYHFHTRNPNLAAKYYRRYLALGGEKVDALEALLSELRGP